MICQGNYKSFNIGFVFVIARSEATKQSQYEIATPSASQKARNDRRGIATPPFGGLAMIEEGRLPQFHFGKPSNDNHPTIIARSEGTFLSLRA
jgi:hypothetical protein